MATIPVLEESTHYENCIGEKVELPKTVKLSSFMDLDEDEADKEDADREWKKHWKGMPEFINEKNEPFKKLIVSFRNEEDYKEFAALINQKNITLKTKSIWHPIRERGAVSLMRWIEE
jgi:hypothetical protein